MPLLRLARLKFSRNFHRNSSQHRKMASRHSRGLETSLILRRTPTPETSSTVTSGSSSVESVKTSNASSSDIYASTSPTISSTEGNQNQSTVGSPRPVPVETTSGGFSNILTKATEWLKEKLIDGGYLPHFIIRLAAQYQFRQRAREIRSPNFSQAHARKMAFIEELHQSKIAIHTDTANQQHYDVAPGVMAAALGPRMKYSCCLFPAGTETLAEAETAMLASYATKLSFTDGMSLLDIGCGWGAAVLYFASRFPSSPITGFTNSQRQRTYILTLASSLNLSNITIHTGDIVTADLGTALYDRLLSCEMFEHCKNYDLLMAKTSRALRPGGQFLLHVFCHRDTPYHFADGWMARHFFTGGTMPSADLMLYFQQGDLKVRRHWWIEGRHYNRTIECWLRNFVANREGPWPGLCETYGGEEEARVWFRRWQVYYLACAEMFVSGGGDTYGVTHYLFEKTKE